MRVYEYRHTVPFEETNVVGNVYFANHLRWQGHCRELFLREHAPDLLAELARDLRLVTLRCSCEYVSELFAFDEVLVQMRLGSVVQNRITLCFEYLRVAAGRAGQLVARGEQEIACMVQQAGGLVPTPIPSSLRHALLDYAPARLAAMVGGGQ